MAQAFSEALKNRVSALAATRVPWEQIRDAVAREHGMIISRAQIFAIAKDLRSDAPSDTTDLGELALEKLKDVIDTMDDDPRSAQKMAVLYEIYSKEKLAKTRQSVIESGQSVAHTIEDLLANEAKK